MILFRSPILSGRVTSLFGRWRGITAAPALRLPVANTTPIGASVHSFGDAATGVTGDHGGILDTLRAGTIHQTFLAGSTETARYDENGPERTEAYTGPLLIALFGDIGAGEMWEPGSAEGIAQYAACLAYATEAEAAGRDSVVLYTPWPPSGLVSPERWADATAKVAALRDYLMGEVEIPIWIIPSHLLMEYMIALLGAGGVDGAYSGDGFHPNPGTPSSGLSWMVQQWLTMTQDTTPEADPNLVLIKAAAWGILTANTAITGIAGPSTIAPTITEQPSIAPPAPEIGESITLDLGAATGTPTPAPTWTLALDGIDISDQVDEFFAIEITEAGDYVLSVSWTNSAGTVAATAATFTVIEEVPAGPTLDDLRAGSFGYFDAVSTFSGPDTAITGITNDGTGSVPWLPAGSGAEIQHTADGFTFADGKRIQATISLTGLDGVIALVKFRMSALDASSASLLCQFGTSSTSLASCRYSGTSAPGFLQYQHRAAGTTTNLNGGPLDLDETHVMAIEVDRIAGVVRYYSGGDIVSVAASPTTQAMVQVQVGSNLTGRIEVVSLITRPSGGAWPITLDDALAAVGAGAGVGPFDTLRVMPALIQSEGRPAVGETAAMTAVAPDQGVSVTGLRNAAGTLVPIWGAGDQELDQDVAATGFAMSTSVLNTRSSTSYAAQYAWLADQPATTAALIGDNGFGGLYVEQYLTTTTGFIGENNLYYLEEVDRMATAEGWTVDCPWFLHFIGTSGKTQPYAEWYSSCEDTWDQFRGWCLTLFGATPAPVLVQTGGDVNTGSDPYHVTAAQYALTLAYSGIIATHQRIYPIEDVNIHPSPRTRVQIGETVAWAISAVEAAEDWTVTAGVVKGGTSVTVTFDLRPGEELVNRSDLYDDFGGAGTCIHYGFEADGGIASAVPNLAAGTVAITLNSASAAWLRFAMQRQDVSSFLDGEGNTMSAHRTTLFPDETRASAMYPGDTLWRSLPSFSGTFSGDTFSFGAVP